MKKLSLTALAIASFTLSLNTSAANIEAGVVKNIPVFQEASVEYRGLDNPDVAENINQFLAERQNKDQVEGPASGISYFEISGVISSQYPYQWESTANKFSTTENHGGAETYVSTFQLGYGNISSVTFTSGTPTLYRTNLLCGTYTVHYCSVGETVIGWEYIYRLNNITSGQFNISAYSTAYPTGVWSDSLYIN